MVTPTRKKPVSRETSEDFEQQPEGGKPLPDEQDWVPPYLEIEKLVQEYSMSDGEIRFQVFREGPAGYRDVKLVNEMPPNEFSLKMLQYPPYNGGKFRVYIRDGTGLVHNFGISVEQAYDVPKPAAVAPADTGIAAMIAAMSAGFQQMGQMIRQQQVTPAGGLDLQGTITLLGALKPLMGGASAVASPAQDPLLMFERFMTLQKTLGGPAPIEGEVSSGALLLETIRSFSPLVQKMIEAKAGQGVTVDQPAQPAALDNHLVPRETLATLPVAQLATTDAQERAAHPEILDMAMRLEVIKPAILAMAASDADTYPYASLILDALTDDQVEKYIQADDWWPALLTMLPEAKTYQPWFEKLRTEAVELLKPESE